MRYIFYAIVFLLVIDVIGFMAWALSGQFPADNFYAGIITKNVLQLVF